MNSTSLEISVKEELFFATKPVVAQRGIHLDLKGLAPSFDRLLRLLEIFKVLNFQIILLEWEDMFPWTCDERFRNPHAYTRDEVGKLSERCEELGLRIIPLVQGLGHSENVLRISDYKELREVPNRTDVFHPMNPEAPALLARMVCDVLELFPHVTHFHLGGDEVFTLGQHPKSRAFIEENGIAALYLKQLELAFVALEKRNIRPMLWHDEVAQWDAEQIKVFSQKTDLVAWGYTGDPRDVSTYHHRLPHVDKLHSLGCTLWGATAYKGADGPKANLPDTHSRAAATLGWAEVSLTHELRACLPRVGAVMPVVAYKWHRLKERSIRWSILRVFSTMVSCRMQVWMHVFAYSTKSAKVLRSVSYKSFWLS